MLFARTEAGASIQANFKIVMPAQAGSQVHPRGGGIEDWIPAYAGMTEAERTIIRMFFRRPDVRAAAVMR